MPIFHAEIDGVGQAKPPELEGYEKYYTANKRGTGYNFSVWPAIGHQVEEAGLDSLVITGAKRGQCVANTIYGEPVSKHTPHGAKKPGTAACEKYNVYTAAMYTYDSMGSVPIDRYENQVPPKDSKPVMIVK